MKRMSAQRMYFIVAIGLTFIAWALWLLLLPGIGVLIAYICAINVTALLLYGWDKAIAVMDRKVTRVPEVVLHGVALAGGSPMALMAQKVFRHKTRKAKFQVWYYVVVFAQAAALLLWLGI